MDCIYTPTVLDIWKKNGKKLKHPTIYFALFGNKVYYVFRDDSFIIFMISKNSNITYAIPKKYCSIKKHKSSKYYEIENIIYASVVSCIGTKSDYEKLIIDNVIPNHKC